MSSKISYNVQDLISAVTEGISQEEIVDFWEEQNKWPFRFKLWPLTHAQRAELERMDVKIGQSLMGENFNQALAQAVQEGNTDEVAKAAELIEKRRKELDLAQLYELGDKKIATAVAYSVNTIETLWAEADLRAAIKTVEAQISECRSEMDRREMEKFRKQLIEAKPGDLRRELKFSRNAPCPVSVIMALPHQMPAALYWHVQKLNVYDLQPHEERQLLEVVAKFRPQFVREEAEKETRTGLSFGSESSTTDMDAGIGLGSGREPGEFQEGNDGNDGESPIQNAN